VADGLPRSCIQEPLLPATAPATHSCRPEARAWGRARRWTGAPSAARAACWTRAATATGPRGRSTRRAPAARRPPWTPAASAASGHHPGWRGSCRSCATRSCSVQYGYAPRPLPTLACHKPYSKPVWLSSIWSWSSRASRASERADGRLCHHTAAARPRSGQLDECGVCNGDARSCALHMVLDIKARVSKPADVIG